MGHRRHRAEYGGIADQGVKPPPFFSNDRAEPVERRIIRHIKGTPVAAACGINFVINRCQIILIPADQRDMIAPPRARATARPIPRLAPVTGATRWAWGCVTRPSFRELLNFLVSILVRQWSGVITGEAMVGVLRLFRIATLFMAHGMINAVNTEKSQTVGTDIGTHFSKTLIGGEKLLFVGVSMP